MANSKQGVPKKIVRNPLGVNQYAPGKGKGEKDSRVELRLSAADKRCLKEAAQKKGMSLSSWILEVVIEAANN
jgi:predicted HicB family RNase H-like nuclease